MRVKFFTILSAGALLMAGSLQAAPYKWWEAKHHQNVNRTTTARHAKTQQAMELPLKAQEYSWNTGVSNWVGTEDVVYAYDNHANMISELFLSPGTTDSMSKTLYAYNIQGEQTSYESYTYNSGWELMYGDRTTFTYNSTGKLASEESESYNASMSSWDKDYKTTYTYNANGQYTEILDEMWDGTAWVNDYRTSFTYGGPNGIEVTTESWNGTGWDAESKYINVVWNGDVEMEPSGYIEQEYDGTNWVNSSKYNAVYDANGGYVALTQEWDGSNWVDNSRETHVADSHGNETKQTYESWDGSAWTKVYESETIYTYNGDKITERIEKTWDNTAQQTVNNRRYVFSDFTTVVVTSATNKNMDNSTRLYPNPVQNLLNIEAANSYRTATITDLSGRTVASQRITSDGTLHFDLSSLQSGIYLLQLQGNGTSAVQKIVKQ